MVKDCNKEYTYTCYKEYIDAYPFELDSFQKYALHAILEEKHSLVTAHTGSGKTLPAEFAIQYFCGKRGRKVIYTSPIKSLSNQKFYDFTKSFGDLSIGICTGDIKYNTDADCIIMTTEILRNYLIHPRDKNKVDFDMDIDELSCIIFDEVHYINDSSRGHIWEECMMLMPKHIQMVMLSATIDKPELFAKWIEKNKSKKVLMASLDIYRPAAQEQLLTLGENNKIAVLPKQDKKKPLDIAKIAKKEAEDKDFDVLILDSAGRNHIDKKMM